MGKLSPPLRYRQVDYRTQEPERLPECLASELEVEPTLALLWTAKRPKKRWYAGVTKRMPLVFTTAPQFEQILWLPEGSPLLSSRAEKREATQLLNDYPALFQGSVPVESCPRWKAYEALLRSHITRQETSDFPQLLRQLPAERGLRELGYEHRGLEKGLERLPQLLTLARDGTLEPKSREMIDLDYYHLLEHHLEREQEAIYPATIFLNQG